MPFPLETLAALATIAGTVISVLALLQSQSWLLLTSLCFACLSFGTGLYARRQRLALKASSTVIEGRSIDSLNMANLRRGVNRTFVIQEAHHTARIEGQDLEITWSYSGYCKVDGTSAMEFSVDAEHNIPFDDLECAAYDLKRDPDMSHPIRPLLVGPDGISKKIAAPFLEPLNANQPFGVLLKCSLPRCVKRGIGYYTSTLSFDQDRVPHCTVHLVFVGTFPDWVRVYECTPRGPPALLRTLVAARKEADLCEYVDDAKNRKGQSARVYVFARASV